MRRKLSWIAICNLTLPKIRLYTIRRLDEKLQFFMLCLWILVSDLFDILLPQRCLLYPVAFPSLPQVLSRWETSLFWDLPILHRHGICLYIVQLTVAFLTSNQPHSLAVIVGRAVHNNVGSSFVTGNFFGHKLRSIVGQFKYFL